MVNNTLPLPNEHIYLCVACAQDGIKTCADLLVIWPKDEEPEHPMPLCQSCFINQIPDEFESIHKLSHGMEPDYHASK